MPKINPFENFTAQYEDWFEKNRFAYKSELNAVMKLMPPLFNGVEIGVGSGRFAAPLGIKTGVEPSLKMAQIAEKRGIKIIQGTAENLPLEDSTFNLALMVTTICFVDDPTAACREAYRILKSGGIFINGFVDKDSALGKIYLEKQDKSLFYKPAVFVSVDEVSRWLREAGFKNLRYVQTIFHPLEEITRPEPVIEGYGKGSFVVVSGEK